MSHYQRAAANGNAAITQRMHFNRSPPSSVSSQLDTLPAFGGFFERHDLHLCKDQVTAPVFSVHPSSRGVSFGKKLELINTHAGAREGVQ